MKEIKVTTIYNEKIIRDFLNMYYKERTKKMRLIINILIIMIILYFFTNKNKTIVDYITYIFALFGILELNTSMIPRIRRSRSSN